MPDEPKRIKPFNAVLAEIERGRFHDEASEALAQLTKECREQGKAGAFVLTLKLAPMSKMAGVIGITGDVTIKPPKPPRDEAIFYDDDDGNLLRDDPRNIRLPGMRAVDDIPLDTNVADDPAKEGTNE